VGRVLNINYIKHILGKLKTNNKIKRANKAKDSLPIEWKIQGGVGSIQDITKELGFLYSVAFVQKYHISQHFNIATET